MNEAPITLAVTRLPHAVEVRVLGSAASTVRADFVVAVDAGSNVSEHRGTALIVPARNAVLSSITVAMAPDAPWRVALRVTPDGGVPYEEVRASNEA